MFYNKLGLKLLTLSKFKLKVVNMLQETRNKLLKYSLLFGLIGAIIIVFIDLKLLWSFLFGLSIGIAYFYHLSFSVERFTVENKSVHSIIRLILTVFLMVFAGNLLSLNVILICAGFLCTHLSVLTYVVLQIIQYKAGQSCK